MTQSKISTDTALFRLNDLEIEEHGRSFMGANALRFTKTDVDDGLLFCVGMLVKAKEVNPYIPLPKDGNWFSSDLIDAAYQLLNKSNWHTPKLLRLAIFVLAKREFYLANLFKKPQHILFFQKTKKTTKNELTFETWRMYFEKNGPGTTGLGCLEALRLIGNTGVFVPTYLFDLCHLLANVESNAIKVKNSDHFYSKTNPGEALPYQVEFSEKNKEVNLVKNDGTSKITLNECFGSSLHLTCKPERMQWLCDDKQPAHHMIHLKVMDLSLSHSLDRWSLIGQDQLFAIVDDAIITLPVFSSFRITDRNTYEFETDLVKHMDQVLSRENPNEKKVNEDLEQKKIGSGSLGFYPETSADGPYKKRDHETYCSIGLAKSIFDHFVESMKNDRIKNIRISAFFTIERAYTTSSKYEGASDFIFHDVRKVNLHIDDFSIEYKIG